MTVRINPSPYHRPLNLSYASDNLALNGTNEVVAAQAWIDACVTAGKIAVLDGTLSISSQLVLKGSFMSFVNGKIVNLALNDGTFLVLYNCAATGPTAVTKYVVIEDLKIDGGALNCNGFKAWNASDTTTPVLTRSIIRNLYVTNVRGSIGIQIHGWINTLEAIKVDNSVLTSAMVLLQYFNGCVVNGLNCEQDTGGAVGLKMTDSQGSIINGLCIEGTTGEAFAFETCERIDIPSPYFEAVSSSQTAGDRIIGRIGYNSFPVNCVGVNMTNIFYLPTSAGTEYGDLTTKGDRIYVDYAYRCHISGAAVELTQQAVDCFTDKVRPKTTNQDGGVETPKVVSPLDETDMALQPVEPVNLAHDPFFLDGTNAYPSVTVTGGTTSASGRRYPGQISSALAFAVTNGVTLAEIILDYSSHPDLATLAHSWVSVGMKFFISSTFTYFDGSTGRVPHIYIEAIYGGSTYYSPKFTAAQYKTNAWNSIISTFRFPTSGLTGMKVHLVAVDGGSAVTGGPTVHFTSLFIGKRPREGSDLAYDRWQVSPWSRVERSAYRETMISTAAKHISAEFSATTTNNTATEIFIGAVSNWRFVLPNNSTASGTIVISGQESGGKSVAKLYYFCIRRAANAASTVMVAAATATTIATDTASATPSAPVADTTNGSLKIEVTGETAKTFHWMAHLEADVIT